MANIYSLVLLCSKGILEVDGCVDIVVLVQVLGLVQSWVSVNPALNFNSLF